MGNRSKRGRPDPDAPDPVGELQEASHWSGFTQQNIRWAHTLGSRSRGFRRRIPMPPLGVWVVLTIAVFVLFGGNWLVTELFS